jgi:predicted DNA-binding antitoxin AbrB/MazE fold protein
MKGKPRVKRPLEKIVIEEGDNIKIDFRETKFGDTNWTESGS